MSLSGKRWARGSLAEVEEEFGGAPRLSVPQGFIRSRCKGEDRASCYKRI